MASHHRWKGVTLRSRLRDHTGVSNARLGSGRATGDRAGPKSLAHGLTDASLLIALYCAAFPSRRAVRPIFQYCALPSRRRHGILGVIAAGPQARRSPMRGGENSTRGQDAHRSCAGRERIGKPAASGIRADGNVVGTRSIAAQLCEVFEVMRSSPCGSDQSISRYAGDHDRMLVLAVRPTWLRSRGFGCERKGASIDARRQ
jgi:hypothetical protein